MTTNSSESAPDMLGMVEKVADALAADTDSEIMFMRGDSLGGWQQLANTALKALREPTPEMVEAGQKSEGWGGDGGQIYRAMIDAALAGKE